MTAQESASLAWGVSLGSLHWSVQALSPDRHERTAGKVSSETHVPASILLGRLAGEPLRLDCWSPPHPRGTAAAWPPEATVSCQSGGGRFPIAAAWTGRNDDQNLNWPWLIDDDERELDSLDAIAIGASQLTKIHASDSPTAIVIPNDFRQREQQRLLDACNDASINASLLWLPVAAALNWLRQNQHHLSTSEIGSENHFTLPVVHCDWGQIRCSTIQLVRQEDDHGQRWMPARKRPRFSDQTIAGFGWSEAAGCHGENYQDTWRELFASSVGSMVFKSRNSRSNVLEQVAQWNIEQSTGAEIDAWLANHLSTIENPASIVFVGDFAEHVSSGAMVSKEVRHHFRQFCSPTVATGSLGEEYLATGASIFAVDRHEGRTSYLDTLPDLELFVNRNYEFEWMSLLGDSDQFVPGGQEWKLPNPIDDLAVRRGASSIKLVVAHEEYPGVRELQVKLDRTAELDLAAELHVSATPAQGNAQLRLVTEELSGIPSQSILANWNRMTPLLDSAKQPISKEDYANSRPRSYPNLRPRPASLDRWGPFQTKAQHFLSSFKNAEELNANPFVLDRLISLSRIVKGQSAVSSDGNAPPGRDQVIVDDLIQILFEYVSMPSSATKQKTRDEAARVLAFMSANCSGLDEWLRNEIGKSPQIDETTCIIAGHCIQDAVTASRFVLQLLGAIPTSNLGRLLSYQMKALGFLLSQRQEAMSKLPLEAAEQLVEECLRVFQAEVENDKLAWLFEHSGLAIVYALRYRMYDPSFLDPESPVAMRAKELFSVAIEKLTERSKRKRRYGYAGNYLSPERASRLLAALRQLIDYIDKRGEGDILIALD